MNMDIFISILGIEILILVGVLIMGLGYALYRTIKEL